MRGNEKWLSRYSLVFLLCSTKDVQARCTLGNVAFQSFWMMWMRVPNIPWDKRMLMYNAMVVPRMLYNDSNWTVPTIVLHKRDDCHRRHLRSILRMRCPSGIIANEDIYVRCNTGPLSQQVRSTRRCSTMFCACLRIPLHN